MYTVFMYSTVHVLFSNFHDSRATFANGGRNFLRHSTLRYSAVLGQRRTCRVGDSIAIREGVDRLPFLLVPNH